MNTRPRTAAAALAVLAALTLTVAAPATADAKIKGVPTVQIAKIKGVVGQPEALPEVSPEHFVRTAVMGGQRLIAPDGDRSRPGRGGRERTLRRRTVSEQMPAHVLLAVDEAGFREKVGAHA